MNPEFEIVVLAILIGTGATAILDLWAALLERCFAVPSANWNLVGRWVGHLAHGRFAHPSIARATPIQGERLIGWSAHYAIGIAFASALLGVWGLDWAHQPTFWPALIFGVLTVAFPFFLMQPGMGAGVAASKTPNPGRARLRSLVTHAVFGAGMYVAALATTLLLQP
jgi:hypothetical protein